VNAKLAAKLFGGRRACSEEASTAARNDQLIAVPDGTASCASRFGNLADGGILPGIADVLAILAPRTISDVLAPVSS